MFVPTTSCLKKQRFGVRKLFIVIKKTITVHDKTSNWNINFNQFLSQSRFDFLTLPRDTYCIRIKHMFQPSLNIA
jgi:hypothetical protein